MAKDYNALAKTVVELVGGEENVISLAHCMTRLRFKLKDESKANTEKLNSTPGVIQVMQAGGRYGCDRCIRCDLGRYQNQSCQQRAGTCAGNRV